MVISNAFFSTNDLTYVILYSELSKSSDKTLKFLVDTGASISLIKSSSLCNISNSNSKSIVLNGLSLNAPVKTQGELILELEIHKKKFNVQFQLLTEETNIPFDGLLGDDFFRSQSCRINYAESSLSINALPFKIPLCRNTPQYSRISISLNPRSETVVPINIINPDNVREGIIKCQFLNENHKILIPNAMVSINENNLALITMVNMSNVKQIIPIPDIQIEAIPKHDSIFNFNVISDRNEVNNEERIHLLNQNLRLDHLNKEESESIKSICEKFNDIFHLPNDMLSTTTAASHEIPTTNNIPIHTKSYRYPEIHKTEVNKQIELMLKQGIIKPSVSPWSSPLWVVAKKQDASGERKWRIVIDYRKLNDNTIGDAYPLPNIDDILDNLGRAEYFTTLDLASGFHQIPMDPHDSPKTAFSTPTGHYEFTRMPFGLKNAPASFQRMMNAVLSGLTSSQCFVYLDDVVIYGSSLLDHNVKLNNIFDRLRHHNLKLQPDKCEFLRKSCEYLGHVISDKGIQPNPKKIEFIQEIPRPKTSKQIKSFLGMVGYYRKFINNFATLAKPLTRLLKKDETFIWTDEQENAFKILKSKLITKPILQYPDFNRTFVLTTDASNYGIGGVLSQINEQNHDLPIAYYSRTLNKAEQNYSTTEKELLAIVNAIEHFRPYLYGRKFTIFTDHRPLQWLFNCQNPNSKLCRWRIRLSEYEYEIKHKAGRVNSNADGLSRLLDTDKTLVNTIIKNTNFQDFIKFYYSNRDIVVFDKENQPLSKIVDPVVLLWSQDLDESNLYSEYIKNNFDMSNLDPPVNGVTLLKNDKQTFYLIHPLNLHFDKPEYKNMFKCFITFKSLIKNQNFIFVPPINYKNLKPQQTYYMLKFIFNNNLIKTFDTNKITPKSMDEIDSILRDHHDSKLSGHFGFNKTYSKIKDRYNWPNMKTDIRKYIRNCRSCQLNKTNFKPTRQPMEITSTSDKPFDKIFIDVVGPLPLTENGNRFIITAQDDLTKFSFAQSVHNHESLTIAKTLTKLFMYFGIPRTILTDQGTDFTSNLIKNLSNLFKTKHVTTTPYHPQTNGALERSHLTLKDYLKHFINDKQTDWDEYIEFAMFSYNSTIHLSTNYSPYELLFGHKNYLPSSIVQEPTFSYTYDDYIKSLQYKLNTAFKVAKENIISSKTRSKESYDRKCNSVKFRVNDLVCIYNKSVKANLSKKLSPNFRGPYKIIELYPNQTALLQIGKKLCKYHTNLLKHFVTDE